MQHSENYFFAETLPASGFLLPPGEGRHAKAVLRLKPGDGVLVTDGQGRLAECEVTAVERAGLRVRPVKVTETGAESPAITLAAALTKKPAFEAMVEAISQFPVAAVLPFTSAFTEVQREQFGKWRPRLAQKAVAGLKQSKRVNLTAIAPPLSFGEVVAKAPAFGFACLFEKVAHGQDKADPVRLSKADTVLLIVGPEGGFHESELELARENRIPVFRLGRTRLRAETAAPAAVAGLLALLGKML